MKPNKRVLALSLLLPLVVLPEAPAAAACERVVVVNPQLTVVESAGRVVFTVFSGGCAAAGELSYVVTLGSAAPVADVTPVSGRLRWEAGDPTTRRIIVPVTRDGVIEPHLEDFTVRLTDPSPGVRVSHGTGHGRVLDDDALDLVWALDDQICPIQPVGYQTPPGEPWLTTEQRMLCDFGDGVIDAVARPIAGPSTIRYGTADGTARDGYHYVGVQQGWYTVPPETSVASLPIQLLPPTSSTAGRWFTVRITGVSAGVVADAVGTVMLGGASG